jgi:hypothetical protein
MFALTYIHTYIQNICIHTYIHTSIHIHVALIVKHLSLTVIKALTPGQQQLP